MQSQMVWFPAAGCGKLVLSGKSFVLTSIVSVIGAMTEILGTKPTAVKH